MRRFPILALAVLAACSGARSKIIADSGDFPHHRCIGVAPFVDARGKGGDVADAIEAGLQLLMYEPVNQKTLADVLAANMPDRSSNLGIESLEKIKAKVPVDAIIFGRIAPDWSTVVITVNETETGSPILQVALRPHDRNEAAFASPEEIAQETVRVLTSLR